MPAAMRRQGVGDETMALCGQMQRKMANKKRRRQKPAVPFRWFVSLSLDIYWDGPGKCKKLGDSPDEFGWGERHDCPDAVLNAENFQYPKYKRTVSGRMQNFPAEINQNHDAPAPWFFYAHPGRMKPVWAIFIPKFARHGAKLHGRSGCDPFQQQGKLWVK